MNELKKIIDLYNLKSSLVYYNCLLKMSNLYEEYPINFKLAEEYIARDVKIIDNIIKELEEELKGGD